MIRAARQGRALVLVGHGSHLSPDSGTPVYDHARRIRETGLFDEVVEVFWKEEPSLREGLDMVESPNVWIVPLFLAEGYFTRQVLPREMGLDGPVTLRGHRRIVYCPPVGTHPEMADLILARARETRTSNGDQPAALVVVGHGTDRSDSSADTVYSLIERLRQNPEFPTVACGFLDEEPRIGDVLDSIGSKEIVLVPFLVAEGWHTRTTIPDELGLSGPLTRTPDRRIWYTPPVGTSHRISDVVISIAREAGAFHTPAPARAAESAPTLQPVPAAHAAFLAAIDAAEPGFTPFLQLAIRRASGDTFEIRHRLDVDSPLDRLDLSRDPDAALSIARFQRSGSYRPLRSADDLRPGWALVDLSSAGLWRALDLFYPAGIVHWHRHLTSEIQPVDFLRWAQRQTGIYSHIHRLPTASIPKVVNACCERRGCLRVRLWDGTHPDAGRPDDPILPCREPCTLFAASARDALATIDPARSAEPR